METPNVQIALFQHVKSVIPPHVSLVDVVADVLNISTDSAYRRIRGEKPVSLEEVQKLSAQFKISIDQILHLQNGSYLFTGNLTNSTDFTFTHYLQDLLKQFQFMNTFSHRHLYALVKDITPMHHFQLPELAAFRTFFWMRSILQYDDLKRKKFSVKDLHPEHVELCQKIVDAFCKVPTTEIWNIESVNSTLRQIKFYRDAQSFESKEDVKIMYQKVEELINHLEKQAELGLKFRIGEKPKEDAAPYVMLNNELILGDNTFFCELDAIRVTYINHSVLNFMATRDEKFNQHTYAALQNLIRKSAQMSSVGEKERLRFFNRIREKLYHAVGNRN